MDATNASDLDLDRGVLSGQQAVVRCRNSVKAEDFLDSFFIHSIFVQTLSDMSVLLSATGGGYPAMRLSACDVLPRRPVLELSSAAVPHMVWVPGGSADPVISDSVQLKLGTMLGRHITPGLSDNVYLQNYACGDLNGRYRKFSVNYALTK